MKTQLQSLVVGIGIALVSTCAFAEDADAPRSSGAKNAQKDFEKKKKEIDIEYAMKLRELRNSYISDLRNAQTAVAGKNDTKEELRILSLIQKLEQGVTPSDVAVPSSGDSDETLVASIAGTRWNGPAYGGGFAIEKDGVLVPNSRPEVKWRWSAIGDDAILVLQSDGWVDAILFDEMRTSANLFAVGQSDKKLIGKHTLVTEDLLEKAASFQIKGTGFEIAPFRNGAIAFVNRPYVWNGIPGSFEGFSFTQAAGAGTMQIIATAKTDGLTIIAAGINDKFAGIEEWKRLGNLSFSYNDRGNSKLALYFRTCNQGDSVRIPLRPETSFICPMLIMP